MDRTKGNGMKKLSCSFTGHRKIEKETYLQTKARLEAEIASLVRKGYLYFYNGGALGFDTMAAIEVLRQRKTYPQIKLVMALPHRGQEEKWTRVDKEIYHEILKRADQTVYLNERYHAACMFERNRYLVDHSDVCIAYLTRHSGGTAYTVHYAQKRGLEIINIAK